MQISDLNNEKLREALEKSSKFAALDDEARADFLAKLAFVKELSVAEKIIRFLGDDQEVEERKSKTLQAKKEFFLGKMKGFKHDVDKLGVLDRAQVEREDGLGDVSENLIK